MTADLEQPIYRAPNVLTPDTADPVPRMDHKARLRYRLAAGKAKTLYPGPVGELIARELLTVEEFGWQLGGQGLGNRLVEAIEAGTPTPGVAAQSATRGSRPIVPHVRLKPTVEALQD